MWKAFFLAIGIILCILGGECLVIDKAVLAKPPESAEQVAPATFLLAPAKDVAVINELKPAEWAPWTLLASGAVIILYSIVLPRRNS